VGANTAIFSVVYATQFAPLPFPHPDQLVSVWTSVKSDLGYPSPKDFIEWRAQSRAFQELSAFAGGTFDVGGLDQPENVWGMRVTSNYYRTLGSSFFLGRDFLADEDHEGMNHVVILTHKLWYHLGADPNLIGHTLRVDGEPYTVVGVLRPGIADRDIFQMAVPLVFTPEEIRANVLSLVVAGRLRLSVSTSQAQQSMDAITARLAQSDHVDASVKGVRIRPLQDTMASMSSDMKQALWLLLGAVGLVLLIACGNVANLLLARGVVRQRDIAVRCAMGATRSAIFAQMFTESFLLAGTGGLLGIGLGYTMLSGLLAAMPRFTLPWEADLRLSLPVLLFALGVTIFASVSFGCIPAWYASRTDPSEAFRGGRNSGAGVGLHRLQRMLTIGELSLALALLSGMGLALHSFINLMLVDTGVRTDHVLTFYLSNAKPQLGAPEKLVAYYQQLLSRIQSVPGVLSASAQTGEPLFPPHTAPFTIVGETSESEPSTLRKTGFGAISPEYFKTFGIRLLQGRALNERDRASAVRVAVVNEDFVNNFLHGTNPLLHQVSIKQSVPGSTAAATSTQWQIVGVYHSVRSGSMREHPPEMLISFWQSPSPGPVIAVRTAQEPDSMIKSLAAAIHSVDSSTNLARPRSMEQIRAQVLGYDRFTMILFVSFGVIALLLAALGVYGVTSFSVEERTREIAIRMALGAHRGRVIIDFLREGFWMACVGLGFGLIGAWIVGRGMRSTLFGIGSIDLKVLGTVALLLLLAALLACLIPARRAASVDPMQALRVE
jgi:putative ABC transport system permease protein